MNRLDRKIRSILFDFGGTLDSDGVNWKERFLPLYQQAGLRWTMAEFEQYFYASDDFICAKKLTNESYYQTLKLQVSLVLKNGGSFQESLSEKIVRSFLKDSQNVIQRNKKVLRLFKKRYHLGIVSNFYGNLAAICRELKMAHFFDVLVDSAIVGYSKPDPRIFFCALNELQLLPQETLFVGDSVSRDMMGSKAIGMEHIWLKAAHLKTKQACCKKDTVIGSLLDLEKIL